MNEITILGIDLAKNTFQLIGVGWSPIPINSLLVALLQQ
jgi:hypothetical protein